MRMKPLNCKKTQQLELNFCYKGSKRVFKKRVTKTAKPKTAMFKTFKYKLCENPTFNM